MNEIELGYSDQDELEPIFTDDLPLDDEPHWLEVERMALMKMDEAA
jgi:hypothetical protein